MDYDQQRALRDAALASIHHADRIHGVTSSDLLDATDKALDLGITHAQIDAEIDRYRRLGHGR